MRRFLIPTLVVLALATGWARLTPGAAKAPDGPSSADVQRIDTIVEQAMARTGTVGLSLAITRNGRPVFAKAYGNVGPGSSEPLRTTDRFRIGSVSKR